MLFRLMGLVGLTGTIICFILGVIPLEGLSALGFGIAAFITFALITLAVWAIGCFICTRFIRLDKQFENSNIIYRFYTNCMIDTVIQTLRIKLHITGKEILPKEKFLLVCNHRGAMDPLVTMGVLRKYRMGFVAKKELFNIPIISKLMHTSYCLSLDREDVRNSAKVIMRAGEIIKEGKASMGIYPEGTRSKEEEMLPFMPGAFKVAKKGECPIVVATIKNTEFIMKNAPFKRTHVYLDFVKVIDKEFVKENTTVVISNVAREIMEKHMAKN